MGSGHTHQAPLKDSCLGRLDARAKVLSIIPAVFLVNVFDFEHWPAIAVIAAVFIALFAVCGRGAAATLKRGIYFLPFVLFVVLTLPFAADGNAVFSINLGFARLIATDEGLYRAGAVAAKAATSILGVLLLSGTTEAPELFKGLRALYVPKAFVLILSMVYRYLFEIGSDFSKVRRAAAARGFEAHSIKAAPRLSQMAGALLIRSIFRSERVHHAMQARGFDGETRTLAATRFGAREALFLAVFHAVTVTGAVLGIYA